MSELGISLLGLGRAGSFHRESLRALRGVTLRQVYDRDGELAKRIAAEEGCRVARDAAEATGATDVDAVIVATPTRTHHEYVIAALEAGKAVLSEKPLGTDLTQIDRGFGLARERGVPLLVAYQRRFDPSFAAVIAAARAGEIGPLQFVRSVSRDHPVPSLEYLATSGGIFHDCLVHDLDLVCQIAGENPVGVFAFGSNFVPEIGAQDDVDNVVVSLRFPSGLLASIDASRTSEQGYDQRIEVLGTRGMLQTDNRPQTLAARVTAEGSLRPPMDVSFPTRYRDAYRLELECFVECARGEREVPITHAEVHLNHRLADAAERSCREKRPVELG